MSQKDEYQRLASQFVDMWQKNMTSMMNDGDFLRVLMQMMQSGSSFKPQDYANYGNPFTDKPGNTAAAPNAGHDAIASIQSSLASIEHRLATIERSMGEHGGSAKPATRAKTAKSVDGAAKRSPARASGRGRIKKKSN